MLIRLFVILLLAAPFWAQPLPMAPKPHLIDITPKPGFFNEPAIAVNPRDPQQLVVAWQINASIAYSNNGGQSWTVAEGTAPKDYKVSGDVSVAYDAAGHALLCYIAFDKLGTTNYWAHGATRNGIFVRRSLDGGKTWEPDASTVIAHESTPDIPFEDKPWIVTDVSGKHAGNIYVGWTQFTLADSDLLFARSTDGGKTWSKPIKLNTAPGLPRDDNGALEGFHGERPAVRLNEAHDDVGAAALPAPALIEHRVRLANARRGSQVHPELATCSIALLRLELAEEVLRAGA